MDPKRKTSLQNKPSEPIPTPTNKADTTNKTLAKPPLKKGSSANQVKPATSQNSSTLSNKSVKSSTDKNEHVNKASLTRVPSKGTLKKDESPKMNIPESLKENKPNLDKNEDNIKELLSVFSTFGQHISTSYNSNIEASHEFDDNFKELFEKIEKFINEAVIPTIPSKADQFTAVLKSLDNVFEKFVTERSTFQSPITRINDSTQSPLTIHGEEKILCEAEIKGFTPETEQLDIMSQKEDKIIEQDHKETWKESPEFLVLKQSLIEATSFQAGYKNIQESLKENYKKAVEQLESYKKEFPEIDMFKSVRNIECSQDMGVFINKISQLQSDSETLRQNIAPKDLKNLEESLAYVSDVCQDIRGILEKEMFYKQSLNLSENKYFNYKVVKTMETHTSEEDQTKKLTLVKENDQLKEQLLSLLDKLSRNSQDFLNMQPSSDDLNTFKSVQRVMKDSALLRMILNLDIRKQEKVKEKEKGSIEKSGGEKKSFQLDEPPSCKKNLRFAEMSSIKKRQETQSPFDLDYDTLKKEVEKVKKENILLVEQKSLLVQKVSETQIIRERLEQINTRLELQAGNLQQQNKILKDKLKLVSEQAQEGEEGYKNLQEQVITLKEAEKEYQAKIETLEQNLNEVNLTLSQLLAERETNEGKESKNTIFEEPKESPEKETVTAEPQKNTFETILENINLVPISKLCKKEGSESNVIHPSQTKEHVTDEKIKSPSLDSGAKNICNTASALGKFFGGSEGYEFEGERLESPPKVSEEDHILLDTKLGEWRNQLKEYLQTQVLCNDKNIPALSVENIKHTVIQQVMKFIDQNLNNKKETKTEEEQEKSPRLKLVDRFDQEVEQTEQTADVFAEIISIRNKLRKAKEIKFILSKLKENVDSTSNITFEEDIIFKLEDQLEEILKSLDQSDLCKETEYTKLIDQIEGEKMDIIERLLNANEKNEQLSKQINVLNAKINHFSSHFTQIKEQIVQTNQHATTYISNEFSSDFVYRILHILTDQLLFAKEVLKLVDTNKKLSLRNIIEEVKAEISSYNRDVKLHYREHKSKQGKEEPLVQLKFISGLFNFYERNYGKIKKMQSKLVENMKIEA